MPIYEFYCRPCHTIFSFFARKVDTETVPLCPKCGNSLSRQVSPVAYLRGGGSGEDGTGDVRVDDSRMEQAMNMIGGDLDKLGESDDPKAAAEIMKKFSDVSGLRFNGDIEDALNRMADGEDPDAVGADLDSMMENIADTNSDAFISEDAGKKHKIIAVPAFRDPTLHDMPNK